MEHPCGMVEEPDFDAQSNEKCGFATSYNLKTWSDTKQVSTGLSPFGIQMENYHGELYGVMTGWSKKLYATKYQPSKGWKKLRPLPEKYKAIGRVAVATLQDRFYVCYRGTNSKVYLIWTYNFETWNDLGEFLKGAVTSAPPAIAGYDGKIYAAYTAKDKEILWATRQGRTHAVLSKWIPVTPTALTEYGLSMVVHHSILYLFHVAENKKAIHCQTLAPGETRWSSSKTINVTNISNCPSAVSTKNNNIYIVYRRFNHDIGTVTVDDAIKKVQHGTIPGKKVSYQTGVATYYGYMIVSFGMRAGAKSIEMDEMNEKDEMNARDEPAHGHIEEMSDDEWDCKWNEGREQSMMNKKKGVFRKLLCL